MQNKTWLRIMVELMVTNNMWWIVSRMDMQYAFTTIVGIAAMFCTVWTICDLFFVAAPEMDP